MARIPMTRSGLDLREICFELERCDIYDTSFSDYEKHEELHERKLDSELKLASSCRPFLKYRMDKPNPYSQCTRQHISNLQFFKGDGSQFGNLKVSHAFDNNNVVKKKTHFFQKEFRSQRFENHLRSLPCPASNVTSQFIEGARNELKSRRRCFSACSVDIVKWEDLSDSVNVSLNDQSSYNEEDIVVHFPLPVLSHWRLTRREILFAFQQSCWFASHNDFHTESVGWTPISEVLIEIDSWFFGLTRSFGPEEFSSNFQEWLKTNENWWNTEGDRQDWSGKMVVLFRPELGKFPFRRAQHIPKAGARIELFLEIDTLQVVEIVSDRHVLDKVVGLLDPSVCALPLVFTIFRLKTRMNEEERMEYFRILECLGKAYVVGFDYVSSRDHCASASLVAPVKFYYQPGIDQLFCEDAACRGMCGVPCKSSHQDDVCIPTDAADDDYSTLETEEGETEYEIYSI
ncbi:unnamed protein product [Caenorhabditis auriculariae]|uniref:Uncharacterized protein n=1 Tax=Caenorhabditis auriculariae TaxID=2777116 RepID=A0A8S1GP26_9PELO|nr:unnamed protein product [Caenorhabditis auriculariae]